MFQDILPNALKILEKFNINIVFVDIGARNGMYLLSDISQYIDAYGFEPNPEEYEKLVTGKTDSVMAGIILPNYHNASYYPYAISNFNGVSELNIYSGPGAGSLLEPNEERLREIVWKGECYKNNFYDTRFSSCKKKFQVETIMLNDFITNNFINYIDFLKIDVESSEYEVLEGAKKILSNVGVIKVETCFIPVREYDFDLLHYEIDPVQVGYKERVLPINYHPIGYADKYGQPLCCDAIYVNRSINEPSRALAQAMVLLDLGYIDEALHILINRASICDHGFFNILKNYRGGTKSESLRAVGYYCVDRIVNYASHIYQILKRIKRFL